MIDALSAAGMRGYVKGELGTPSAAVNAGPCPVPRVSCPEGSCVPTSPRMRSSGMDSEPLEDVPRLGGLSWLRFH
jgi:hypothetical protein